MKTKTLYFEGAGMDFMDQSDKDYSDVGNHRIRTAFLNDNGEKIYLELNHSRVEKKDKRKHCQGYPVGALVAWVDHCFYIDRKYADEELSNEYVYHECDRKVRFPYTLQGILEFVNKEIGCSFDKVEVLDRFEWYYVHGENRTYNLMDDHTPNPKRTKACHKLEKHLNRYYNDKFGTKWPPFSIQDVTDEKVSIFIYASTQAMERAGQKHRNIDFPIERWYEHVTQ